MDDATQSERRYSRSLGIGLAIMFAVGAFFSGWELGQGAGSNLAQSASLFAGWFSSEAETVAVQERPNLDEFWEVWELLDEKFVAGSSSNPLSSEAKLEGAIQGLVGAYGDPYTVYLPPEESKSFAEDISGNFSGVGMEVGIRDNLVTIIAPLPDTPAEGAGLLAGDVIVEIDDTSTEGMRIDEAVKLIRGDKGTVVTLTIFREGELEFLEIPVTRDTIEIPTIQTESVDDTFVIELYSFNAVAEAKMREAIAEFQASGRDTLIVDVRGNPGGYLESAVAIAGFFLPTGKVVVQEQHGADGEKRVFRSRGRQLVQLDPESLVILVDNGSASAAEILAGALRDHGAATIIGSQTFGKGSVQELVELPYESSLKVTVARWLTPAGTSISEGGLTPDIVINRTPQQRVAGEDPQRTAALQFLAGETVESESFADQFASSTSTEAEVTGD